MAEEQKVNQQANVTLEALFMKLSNLEIAVSYLISLSLAMNPEWKDEEKKEFIEQMTKDQDDMRAKLKELLNPTPAYFKSDEDKAEELVEESEVEDAR